MTIIAAKLVTGEEILFETIYTFKEFEAIRNDTGGKMAELKNPRVLPHMDMWLQYMPNYGLVDVRIIMICHKEEEISPILLEKYQNLAPSGW